MFDYDAPFQELDCVSHYYALMDSLDPESGTLLNLKPLSGPNKIKAKKLLEVFQASTNHLKKLSKKLDYECSRNSSKTQGSYRKSSFTEFLDDAEQKQLDKVTDFIIMMDKTDGDHEGDKI